MSAYREDMRRAWDRINSFPTQRLETRFGTIEYADQGDGPPLLVSHGVLGCHVDTVGTGWASLPGPGFRVIGPSRFGYFGSTLPEGGTPADQADAYALLLDHLGVDRAVVIGFWRERLGPGIRASSPRARDRPDPRVPPPGGGVTLGRGFAPLFRLVYSADWAFWAFNKLMPVAYSR